CDAAPGTLPGASSFPVTPLTGDLSAGRYAIHSPTHTARHHMVQRNGGGRLATRPSARPKIGQRGKEIQEFGSIARLPIGLDESVCQSSADALHQTLADTLTLRDMYKKHHWQVTGHTFYQLHLLFDKHCGEQSELVDEIAERI